MSDDPQTPLDPGRASDMLKQLTIANMECVSACRNMLRRIAASYSGYPEPEFSETLELLNAAFDRCNGLLEEGPVER